MREISEGAQELLLKLTLVPVFQFFCLHTAALLCKARQTLLNSFFVVLLADIFAFIAFVLLAPTLQFFPSSVAFFAVLVFLGLAFSTRLWIYYLSELPAAKA